MQITENTIICLVVDKNHKLCYSGIDYMKAYQVSYFNTGSELFEIQLKDFKEFKRVNCKGINRRAKKLNLITI